jgi:hypothetical protein
MVPGYINGLDSILQRKIRSIFAFILCRVGLIVKDKKRTKTDKEDNTGKQVLPLINADPLHPRTPNSGALGTPGAERNPVPCHFQVCSTNEFYAFDREITTPPAIMRHPPTRTAGDGVCLNISHERICAKIKKKTTYNPSSSPNFQGGAFTVQP